MDPQNLRKKNSVCLWIVMSFVEFLALFLLKRAFEVESPSTPLAPLAKGFEAEKMATVSSPNLMFWSYE